MNKLDFYTKLYQSLYGRPWLPSKAWSCLRWLVRNLSWLRIPSYLKKENRGKTSTEIPVYVSFTSFPERINYVWQVVECMYRQTYLPEKIILWLSKDQFPEMSTIPQSLTSRLSNRFEIRFVDGDIRSHKKYLYISREYPDRYVFLIDDDLYYPTDILEKTWKAHLKYPNSIISNYGYRMSFNADGTLKPYSQWKRNYSFSTIKNLFFGSGGGTLFVPERMDSDLTKEEIATKLTPLADDVWLNTMARSANYHVVMLDNGIILPYRIKKKRKLSTTNLEEGLNDRQIRAVIDYYGAKTFSCTN